MPGSISPAVYLSQSDAKNQCPGRASLSRSLSRTHVSEMQKHVFFSLSLLPLRAIAGCGFPPVSEFIFAIFCGAGELNCFWPCKYLIEPLCWKANQHQSQEDSLADGAEKAKKLRPRARGTFQDELVLCCPHCCCLQRWRVKNEKLRRKRIETIFAFLRAPFNADVDGCERAYVLCCFQVD
jgi:hypothetical protein